jgi:hypothetical protein
MCAAPGAEAGPVDVCSNALSEVVDGVPVQVWPTPVCVVPPPGAAGVGNCDPVPLSSDSDGLKIHYCDGPDSNSSPGVCVPFDPANPQTGLGTCYPKCVFGTDGGAASGCPGSDTCAFLGYEPTSQTDAGVVISAQGVGYCQGTCQTDADCTGLGTPADGGTWSCQVNLGYCTTTPVASGELKALGTACSVNDPQDGTCNCFAGPSGSGYCTSRCVVGGVPCSSGWVCDTGQPAIPSYVGLTTGFTVAGPTPGMVGTCAPLCTFAAGSADAGAGADAAGGDASGAADANVADAGASDAETPDAETADAGLAEDAASAVDATVADGPNDGAPADATIDASIPDGGNDEPPPDALADTVGVEGGCILPGAACVGGGAVGADCLPR